MELTEQNILQEGMRELEAAKKIGQERRRIYNMMSNIAQKLNIGRLTNEDLVVNVGCGKGIDNSPINSALSGQPFGFAGEVQVIGVDTDRKALAIAEQHYKHGVTEYIHGNGRNLGELLKGEKPAVVISRHPDIAEKEEEWGQVFMEAHKVLKNGGSIVTTAMQQDERERLRRGLTTAGIPHDKMLLKT